MTLRAHIILVAIGVIALFSLTQQTQNVFAASGLPQDIIQKLVNLNIELVGKSQQARALKDKLGQDKSHFQDLRALVTSDQILRSTNSANYFLVALDGLELDRQYMQTDASLNQQSYNLLSAVAQGLVNGEGYLNLDQWLLTLENNEPKRDSRMGQLPAPLDRIDALIALAENAPDSGVLKDVIGVERLALVSLRLDNNEIITNYDQFIKPGTQSLRHIVDQLPKL